MDNASISKNLLRLRKANDFTQEQVSEKVNITRSTYSNYEKGKRVPSLISLIALADFYEISVDDLIGHAPHPSTKRNGLSRDEKRVIKLYRMLPEILQKEYIKMLNVIYILYIQK